VVNDVVVFVKVVVKLALSLAAISFTAIIFCGFVNTPTIKTALPSDCILDNAV